nr:immunoglobulin heavy chain junction region [Macaca mulatta]
CAKVPYGRSLFW